MIIFIFISSNGINLQNGSASGNCLSSYNTIVYFWKDNCHVVFTTYQNLHPLKCNFFFLLETDLGKVKTFTEFYFHVSSYFIRAGSHLPHAGVYILDWELIDRKQMHWKTEYPKQQHSKPSCCLFFQPFSKFWPHRVRQHLLMSSQKYWQWCWDHKCFYASVRMVKVSMDVCTPSSLSACAPCWRAENHWCYSQHHEAQLGRCSWTSQKVHDHLQTRGWRTERGKIPSVQDYRIT